MVWVVAFQEVYRSSHLDGVNLRKDVDIPTLPLWIYVKAVRHFLGLVDQLVVADIGNTSTVGLFQLREP